MLPIIELLINFIFINSKLCGWPDPLAGIKFKSNKKYILRYLILIRVG